LETCATFELNGFVIGPAAREREVV